MLQRAFPPNVLPMIVARKGSAYFVWTPGVIEMDCYCCGHVVMSSLASQANKAMFGDEVEYICVECWNVLLKHQTQVLWVGQIPQQLATSQDREAISSPHQSAHSSISHPQECRN